MLTEDEFRDVEKKIHSIYLDLWTDSPHEGSVDQYVSSSHREKVFSLIFYLIGEVENGGFSQWIWNPTGDFVQETHAALLEIGATKVANLVAQAMAMFPDGCPSRDFEIRQQQVRALSQEEDDFLFSLGEPFGDERNDLHILLLEYWEANKPKPQGA